MLHPKCRSEHTDHAVNSKVTLTLSLLQGLCLALLFLFYLMFCPFLYVCLFREHVRANKGKESSNSPRIQRYKGNYGCKTIIFVFFHHTGSSLIYAGGVKVCVLFMQRCRYDNRQIQTFNPTLRRLTAHGCMLR